MSRKTQGLSSIVIGIWYSILAYLLWGILPLYWKALQQVPPREILAHRILWSLIFVCIILIFNGRWHIVKKVLSNGSNRIGICLGGLLISANWYTYIWAVNSNRVVEASLGYYINPLFTVALGLLVLKEQSDFWQIVSFLLASFGVAVLAIEYGKIPWVALLLAVTFGLYGLVKKLVNVDSIIGLALETFFVAPIAMMYLAFVHVKGISSFGSISNQITFMLMGAGVATALPLLWFAEGAKRVPFSILGFIQYLSPSISLFLGVFLFKEPFTKAHILSFGLIWLAIALYSFSRPGMVLTKVFQKQ
ncbi:EamA family transporter RarD [Zhaonella formicivorans]|uniref:EamA family transporter RarD n=1 Tax=Zhaonella formicivorans TaxID=2528593 RepID=UPI0010D71C50|nr:EamA family transporter RarD [Zhaonella formicivorans]